VRAAPVQPLPVQPLRVQPLRVRVELALSQVRAAVRRVNLQQPVQAAWPRAAASLQLVAAEWPAVADLARVAAVALVPLVAASPIRIVPRRCPQRAQRATAFKARCAATAR
jgi:hypothetical protein